MDEGDLMEQVMAFVEWIKLNYVNVIIAISALTSFLEIVVRLTPTKTDDGFVSRLGKWIDIIMDFLKIPKIVKAPKVELEEPQKEEPVEKPADKPL